MFPNGQEEGVLGAENHSVQSQVIKRVAKTRENAVLKRRDREDHYWIILTYDFFIGVISNLNRLFGIILIASRLKYLQYPKLYFVNF